MVIRKLENNILPSLLIKIVLIAGVTAGGVFTVNKIIHKKPANKETVLSAKTKKEKRNDLTTIVEKSSNNNFIHDAQSTLGTVLGEATKVVSNTVSSVTAKAEDLVIKAAVDKVMEQVDKLPTEQKEEIKKEICK